MKISEKRTQIYLTHDTFRALKQESKQAKTSIAEIIRQSIAAHLQERRLRKGRDFDWKEDPLSKVAGMVKDGPADLSVNHDHYLYGWKKKSA
jgi:hypothetical protein